MLLGIAVVYMYLCVSSSKQARDSVMKVNRNQASDRNERRKTEGFKGYLDSCFFFCFWRGFYTNPHGDLNSVKVLEFCTHIYKSFVKMTGARPSWEVYGCHPGKRRKGIKSKKRGAIKIWETLFLSFFLILLFSFFFELLCCHPFSRLCLVSLFAFYFFQETSRRVENQVIKQFPIFAHPSRLDLISSKKPEK